MKKPQIVILLGSPGAGKGTQAELLSDKLNLYYLETSKLIEATVMKAKEGESIEVEGKEYSLTEEKKLWLAGVLCSPPFVSFLVKQKLNQLAEEGKGIVMAGSPRTLPEGKDQVPLLKKLYGAENIKVVLIELTPEQTIWRNSHRRICDLMRHPILYAEETEKLTHCPLDGSKLIKREGLDEPETIKVRLKEYKERTLPLVGYFTEEGLKVEKVNGEQSVEAVHQDILKSL
ncbi:MAG: nucleoside monophosphate kinase [Candidatus Nealsonbacteria bacterium]|nr:nucleoside monophosphate kinase [Candidatus Nealsonbacteria bacterium]